jgi:hypothetical protein
LIGQERPRKGRGIGRRVEIAAIARDIDVHACLEQTLDLGACDSPGGSDRENDRGRDRGIGRDQAATGLRDVGLLVTYGW